MDTNTKTGTLGGMLLVLLFNIDKSALLGTAVTAAVGATVSFGISILLKYLAGRFSRK